MTSLFSTPRMKTLAIAGVLTLSSMFVSARLPRAAADEWGNWDEWVGSRRDESAGFWDDVRNRFSSGWREWRNNRAPSSRPSPGERNRPAYGDGGARRLGASVPPRDIPWSGTWWPRKRCGLAFLDTGDGLSPFEKYDTIVYDRTGRVPGAAAWEADPANRHNEAAYGYGASWSGHCNGLAAAAILSPEPRRDIRVPLRRGVVLKLNIDSPQAAVPGLFRDGAPDYYAYQAPGGSITLTVDDMKGWLAEQYMNCRVQQFANPDLLGHRYNRPYIDEYDPTYRDIKPHYFHWLLLTFVGRRKQAIVAEVDPHMAVNNHPLYKYEMDIRRLDRTRYYVTARVWLTDYAPSWGYVGTNPMIRTYTYILYTYDGRRVYNGEWVGSSVHQHPDFIWIPIDDMPAYGQYENPCLDPGTIRSIIAPATR